MATVKEAFSVRFRTTTDAELEEVQFKAGEEVTILKTWDKFYLIRDAHGHCHNVPLARIVP